MKLRLNTQHAILAALCLVLPFLLHACSESAPKTVSKPADTRESSSATRPAEQEPASKPAEPREKPPATRVAEELPPSRYDSHPPYPVELHVRKPEEPQPGWLRILELDDSERPAEVHGSFPEQNLIVVDTQNVRRIDVHIGHLPLAERKRILLRIDGQGTELIRGKRQFVTLEKRPTGAWVVSGSR